MTPCVICQTPSKNKTCSTDQCRRALKNQQQREARAAGIIWGQHPYTCIYCGKQCKSPKRNAKYCSMYCYNMLRYDTIGRVAEEDKAFRRKRRERDAAIAAGTHTYPPRTCNWCAHTFVTSERSKMRCDNCKGNRQGASWRIFHRECTICKRLFITSKTNTTCNKICAEKQRLNSKAVARSRRRAIKKDAFVANVYRADVYARDGYRCHICGYKVNMKVAVPHPKAATLDHLVALANGGTHEPLNVRTAHFICNSLKRDRDISHQMLLIA